ncbi:hypothetical protein FPV67DRAFT_1417508 [Lyophyllum atratum]|nr:hypothetical protein FPV67DRAFT_1417508 [Lyophyllum atratum]
MFAVASDETQTPSQSTIISTRYRLPPQANAYSTSTTVFNVPTPHQALSTVVPPADDPALWNDQSAEHFSSLDADATLDPTLDPAYVAEVEAERVTAKRARVRVSTFQFFTLVTVSLDRCQINQLKKWLPDRDLYLAEFLRLEGRGDHPDICPGHTETSELHHASYRCVDCAGGHLLCQVCMVSTHRHNPLHEIERWTGTYFEKASLKSIGLRVLLGHPLDDSCPIPYPVNDFVVVHTNGIHEVAVDFCGCQQAKPHIVQLLRYHWFPASIDRPCTAATLAVLRHFQLLSFESKASAFEFYNSLKRLTENTGVSPPKDRYRLFMTMVREYRHLKMLKRAGRGHDPAGTVATKPGECAVLCPACPQPGINLKEGWKNASPEDRFLYRLFLAIDANFRLKRKKVSSYEADPGLSKGWAYFLPEVEYKSFLKAFDKLIVQERSTCSNHKAVDAERATKGLAATGVAAVDCARHDVKRPLAVADLIGGERYVTMDSVFFGSLKDIDLLEIVVSYDIVCQWSKHVWDRMAKYPHKMHINADDTTHFYFYIPKFHLPAHIMACQTIYSFNFNPSVGRTDGEGVERGWSHINPVATSTREMGPGSRRDTLDDHFGDWNWKKTSFMGASLLRKIEEAVVEGNDHRQLHDEFNAGLDPEITGRWRAELSTWEVRESNEKGPNPFERKFQVISQDAVRKKLALQESEDTKAGRAYALHEEISASQLITMGLDFEEKQRRLAVDRAALGQHATDKQKSKLQTQSNILRRKIDAWIAVQHLYMPALATIRTRDAEADDHDSDPTEDVSLYLPSALAHSSSHPRALPSSRLQAPVVPCDIRLREMEWELRNAQASDALAELRDGLRLRSYLYIDKDRFQRGQRHNTRSRGIIDRTEVKIAAAASKYRAARLAIEGLAPALDKVGWEDAYPLLAREDIRAMGEADPSVRVRPGPAQGRHRGSWIWTRLGDLEYKDDDLLQDDLRIEWCKGKARADRWQEEVRLLLEEMERVDRFFNHKAVEWESRTLVVCSAGRYDDRATAEGRRAYAYQQAATYSAMRRRAAHLWHHVPTFVAQGHGLLVPEDVQTAEKGDDDAEEEQ